MTVFNENSTKTLDTLQEDIYHVLNTGEGWTDEIATWVAEDSRKALVRQMKPRKEGKPSLRMSSLGQPCERKLWYDFNVQKVLPKNVKINRKLDPWVKLKFIFGDLTESLLLGLVIASGHRLEGLQERVEIDGIVGHRDCIIDGMQFDAKSASTFAFNKFKNNQLKGFYNTVNKGGKREGVWVPPEKADAFGYISQNSSYLFASLDDPRIKHKSKVGFLALDKQFAHVAVDIYDVSDQLEKKREEIQHKKDMVKWDDPPDRVGWGTKFASKKAGEPDPNGNIALDAPCSYCEYKEVCHPGLRTFLSSTGPLYLSRVVKEPKMTEITEEQKEGF